MGDKMWAAVGFISNLIDCLLIVLAFSTPYWIVPENGAIVQTQLERLGLWEFCFARYSDIHDSFGRTYNGCWWLFAREYDAIRQYLITGWFATTQALMTICLLLTLSFVLVGLLILLNCMPSKAQIYCAMYVWTGHFLTAILIAIALVYFGSRAETDRSWLKHPTLRTLSWSFYSAVAGGIMCLLTACFYTVYWLSIRKGGRSSTAYRAHEMRSYRYNYR